LTQPLQAVVELLDGPALPAQWGVLSGDVLEKVSEAALPKPPQYGLALGEESEVPYVVAQFGQTAQGLTEAVPVGDGHGDDDHALTLAQRQVEDLDHALPPGRQVLEVAAQFRRQHPAQPETGVFRVADDAAGQTSLDLVCGLCLAAPEGAVDP